MKLKTDDAGHVVVKDGHPVYINDDNSETPFDAPATIASLNSRRAAAKKFEQELTVAQEKLKAYEGIDDPAAARDALDKISKLDTKKLVDAGQLDAAVAARVKPIEDKLAESDKRAAAAEKAYFAEKVGGAFARSKFIAEKLILPPDIAQKMFGDHFKIEDGQIRAFDAEGHQVFSSSKNGKPADFEEAIEFLVQEYPLRDRILKADNKSGSGAQNNGGGGGQKTMARAEFDAKTPAEKHAFATSGGKVID